MSWIDAVTRFFGAGEDVPATPLPEITRSSSSWDFMWNSVKGLPAVNERSAMTVSTAYACVNLIAGAISSLPMHIYLRKPDGERDQLHNEDLWWVLNEQFLPRWAASNGWEYMVQSLLFHGDAFAEIKRNGAGQVIGLQPIHPSKVQPIPTPDGMRLVYAILSNEAGGRGFNKAIDQDDMLHVAGFGFDGTRSISPLQHHLANSVAVALAMQEYAGRFFANSARPDVVLTTDQKIDAVQADIIRDRWQELYGGLGNSHRPAILGQGFKVEPLTMTAEDAQLLASRQFQIEEVARAFGVPPFMIGHTEKTTSWGSGVETMGTGFVRFTLRQHLTKFQNEFNRKLFRSGGKFVEFDTFELERADMRSLFEGFRVALGRAGEPGFMTTDEVRSKLNLKRLPGGAELAKGADNAQQAA